MNHARLRDVQLPMQLHEGHAFEVRRAKVDGELPLADRNAGPLRDRAFADAEMLPAVPATPRHWLSVGDLRDAGRLAVSAPDTFGSAGFFDPPFGAQLVWKHAGKLNQTEVGKWLQPVEVYGLPIHWRVFREFPLVEPVNAIETEVVVIDCAAFGVVDRESLGRLGSSNSRPEPLCCGLSGSGGF